LHAETCDGKQIAKGKYKQNNINIYPREYFYPFNHDEEFTETCIKKNTYAIHWWGKSWKKNFL